MKKAEEGLQACAAAHEELSKLKAALVPQILAMNDEDCELERVPERFESLPGLSENLQPAEPKPVGLARKKIEGKFFRRRTSNGALPSRREVEKYLKVYHAPPVLPRVTSKRTAFHCHNLRLRKSLVHPVKQKIHLRGCRHVDIEEVMEEVSKANGPRSERDTGLTLV